MRIHYMSDLHLEFGAFDKPLPRGDVLLLVGDITLLAALDPSSENYERLARTRQRTQDFLEACRRNFRRIIYVIGNHEAYGYCLTWSPSLIRRAMADVELLDDCVIELDRKTLLVGGTLWTDMGGGRAHERIRRALNDFRLIRIEKDGQLEDFDTHDAVRCHKRTLELIGQTAETHPSRTIVVATHHAPSVKGLSPEHVHSSPLNDAYYSDLEGFIAAYPNIRHWVHGHTHLQKAYRVAQCRVLSNARGYVMHEDCAATFDPNRWFATGCAAKRAPKRKKAPPSPGTEEPIQSSDGAR
ncbi:MAG: metallophosphoesterase [Bacteroidota bacterium]